MNSVSGAIGSMKRRLSRASTEPVFASAEKEIRLGSAALLTPLFEVRKQEKHWLSRRRGNMYADLTEQSLYRLYETAVHLAPWASCFVDFGSGYGYACLAFGLLGMKQVYGTELIVERHTHALKMAGAVLEIVNKELAPDDTWAKQEAGQWSQNNGSILCLSSGRAHEKLPATFDIMFSFDARFSVDTLKNIAEMVTANSLLIALFISTRTRNEWLKYELVLPEPTVHTFRTSGGETFKFYFYLRSRVDSIRAR